MPPVKPRRLIIVTELIKNDRTHQQELRTAMFHLMKEYAVDNVEDCVPVMHMTFGSPSRFTRGIIPRCACLGGTFQKTVTSAAMYTKDLNILFVSNFGVSDRSLGMPCVFICDSLETAPTVHIGEYDTLAVLKTSTTTIQALHGVLRKVERTFRGNLESTILNVDEVSVVRGENTQLGPKSMWSL